MIELAVVPRDVVNAGGGDETGDASVGSVVIVEVEPVRVAGCALVVGQVDLRVGPFGAERPIEAFNFAVGLGAYTVGSFGA